MKPLERDLQILRHIVSYCDQIGQTIYLPINCRPRRIALRAVVLGCYFFPIGIHISE